MMSDGRRTGATGTTGQGRYRGRERKRTAGRTVLVGVGAATAAGATVAPGHGRDESILSQRHYPCSTTMGERKRGGRKKKGWEKGPRGSGIGGSGDMPLLPVVCRLASKSLTFSAPRVVHLSVYECTADRAVDFGVRRTSSCHRPSWTVH